MRLKLLHTADWHLGQSFHGFERDFEHLSFLDWLVQHLVATQPDVLCIAGDIYDSVNPPASAQRRFFSFLATVHALLPKLQILLTAGNHDAAARLEAPAPLLEAHNARIIGTVSRSADGEIDYARFLVPLKNAANQVAAIGILIPFLRPADLPHIPNAQDAYLGGIHAFYHRATQAAEALRDQQYPGAALVALGHLHMQNASESRDSERRLVIGGAEAVRENTFPDSLAYVALGHLHKPQALAHGRIHYSGSPIPLSFSEKDYTHCVLEVLLDDARLEKVTPIPIPKTVQLIRVPSQNAIPMEELLLRLEDLSFPENTAPERHPFLEIRVLDDGPDPTRRSRIEKAVAGKPVRLTAIRLEAPARSGPETTRPLATTAEDLANMDPEEIMTEAHRERYQREPDPALLEALREIRQICQL